MNPIFYFPEKIEQDEIFVKITPPISHTDNICDYYYISNYGRLYNYLTNRLLTPAIDTKGYPYYNLRLKNGNGCAFRIHRMIMNAFNYIDGCEKMDIHHKDSNKLNFSLSNLEWCNKSYNMREAYRLGEIPRIVGEDRIGSKITKEIAEEICRRISIGEPTTKISMELNVSKYIIEHISHRRSWLDISNKYDFSNKNKTKKYHYKNHLL